MQFLEQIFNLYPDGGNGVTELVIMLSIVLALSWYCTLRQVRRGKPVMPRRWDGAGRAT